MPIGEALGRSILAAAYEAYIAMDARGRIVDWNVEAERTFGFRRAEVLGRELAEVIIPPSLRSEHRAGLQRFLATGATKLLNARTELTALHRDGYKFPVEGSVSAVAGVTAGDDVTFHALLHDISDRKLTERVLRAMPSVTQAMARAETAEAALTALLAELGRHMGWDVGAYWAVSGDGGLTLAAAWADARVDASGFLSLGRHLQIDAGTGLHALAITAREPVWIRDVGRPGAGSGSPGLVPALAAGLHFQICVPVPRGDTVVGVIEFFCADLRVREGAIHGALATVGGQVGDLLGIVEQRQALHQRLAELALTDQLTGLPNRRAWQEGLDRELSRAGRESHPLCVAVIDLDDFKGYNDEHGHLAGDAMLRETARAWRGVLRAGDLLARYGGEEFAVVIPAWPLADAVTVVERLRAATPGGQTCSAGVACWDQHETGTSLFARADAALYAAKQGGRDRTIAAG